MAEFNKKIGELHQLERARNAIRHKHKLLKVARIEAERASSEKFKPIIQPLERLIDVAMVAPSLPKRNKALRTRLKSEMKEEEEEEDVNGDGEGSLDTSSLSAATVVADPNYQAEAGLGEEEGEENKEQRPQRSVMDYVKMLQTDDTGSLDTLVGVRLSRNKLMVGNYTIKFDGEKIRVGNLEFDETPGLVELLFERSPNINRFTLEDEANFVKIALLTHIHHNSFKPDAPRRLYNEKYMQFIRKPEDEIIYKQKQKELKEKKRLERAKRKEVQASQKEEQDKHRLSDSAKKKKPEQDKRRQSIELGKNSSSSQRKGGGILPYKIVQKRARKMDYVYWDDPNELVDRLRLLQAETTAGNPSHTNEISSIIEELREARIIY